MHRPIGVAIICACGEVHARGQAWRDHVAPKHAEDTAPRIIGYTALECERAMRRMTNGEHGCANPEEHLS